MTLRKVQDIDRADHDGQPDAIGAENYTRMLPPEHPLALHALFILLCVLVCFVAVCPSALICHCISRC